jgi:hypothetical protein
LKEELPHLHIRNFFNEYCSATLHLHNPNCNFLAVRFFESATFKEIVAPQLHIHISANSNFFQRSAMLLHFAYLHYRNQLLKCGLKKMPNFTSTAPKIESPCSGINHATPIAPCHYQVRTSTTVPYVHNIAETRTKAAHIHLYIVM